MAARDGNATGAAARQRRIGRIVLLTVSVLVMGVAAELVLRALPDTVVGFRYDAVTGRFGQPTEYDDHNRKNSLGYHDVDHGPPRADERRVLLLGDSYVEGRWAPRHLTVGPRMARQLREKTGRAWDVIAIGKGGWSQREQLAALRRLGPDLRPHVVITVLLVLNDIGDNSQRIRDRVEEQVRGGDLVFRPGWLRRSADEMPLLFCPGSALNRLLSYRIASSAWLRDSRTADSIPVHYFVYATETGSDFADAWSKTERLVVATRDEARALGAQYMLASVSTPHGVRGADAGLAWLLASYPAMRGLSWDLDGPDRRLAEMAARHGIPFLAMEPVFREATARGEKLHWAYDGHWNHAGTDRAARLMSDFVLERATVAASPD